LITMSQLRIRESVAEAPVKDGNRWKVIVARPGVGSSGTYSKELFQRDAAKIVAEGAQCFLDHDDKRSVKDMLGHYSEARWSEEDQAVVSEITVFKHWQPFFEEVSPHCGISLYALGEQDEEGNVTAFIEDSYNGADLVARPGLIGSGVAEKLYESAHNVDLNKPDTETSVSERKDIKMDEKAMEMLESINTALTTLVSAQDAEAKQTAQVEADDKAVEGKMATLVANLDAVETARENLLPSQVKSLLAEARKGGDITDAIATQVALAEEVRGESGRVTESGRVKGSEGTSSTFGAWK